MEMRHEADAVDVAWAGDHEDEVQEEGRPAHHKDAQQDGERDGTLHARPLVDGVVAGQRGDALDVRACQHEHMAVQRGHEHQHGEEHGHQADDDGRRVRVDDEDDAAARAEGPDAGDDERGSADGHDVVVAQRVEDGDVAVHGDGQQATHGRHHRDADQRV